MELKEKTVMSGKLESSYDIIRGKKKKMKKSIFKSLKKLLKKK
jgi:hypothetical protein